MAYLPAPTEAVAQVPVAAAPAKKEQPAKLSRTERWLAALLIVGGVVLIALLLSAFMARSDAWSLKSKESTETTGEKTTTTTEYSDSVLITGLGVGALLVLTGAFYGRIREITLPGGAGLKVGELPEDKQQQLAQSIEGKAEQAAADVSVSAGELAEEARRQAQGVFQQQYWGAVPEPPQEALEDIAEAAVGRARRILG